MSACTACALPTFFVGCSESSNVEPKRYYTSQTQELLSDFDSTFGSGNSVLAEFADEVFANRVHREARSEYEAVIPTIPYIGGAENENSTSQLITAAQCLAIYRTLSMNGIVTKETGQLIYDMFDAWLHSSPQFLVSIYGYFKFHVGWADKIRNYAAMSQEREYPMDFVYAFIEGDGEELDYGVDITECAIQKFLRNQDAEALVPYMCALDNALSIRFDRGLVRTQTLVESNVCDFRYRKGRETQVNLPLGLTA